MNRINSLSVSVRDEYESVNRISSMYQSSREEWASPALGIVSCTCVISNAFPWVEFWVFHLNFPKDWFDICQHYFQKWLIATNVVCKTLAILFWTQWVNAETIGKSHGFDEVSVNVMAADVLAMKHQVISIHNTDSIHIVIVMFSQTCCF